MAALGPGAKASFDRSLQRHHNLPVEWSSRTQDTICGYSVLVLLVLIPLAWIRKRQLLLALTIVVVAVVTLNAAVCGVLSGVYARYQARVIWMIPMLAVLLARDLFQFRPLGSGPSCEGPEIAP
jgi:hypothetical protein